MKLLYFVLFLTILCLSESIIRETELKVSNTPINFEEFGFHSGGSYRIEITNLTSTETSSRMVIIDSVDYHLIQNTDFNLHFYLFKLHDLQACHFVKIYMGTYYFFVFVTDLILYYGIGYTFCFRELGMFQEQDDHQHHNSSSASDSLPPLLEHEIDDKFEGVPIIITNPTKNGDEAEWSVAFETKIQKQPDNVNFQKNDHQQSNPDFNINKNDNIDNINTGDEDDVEYNKYKSNNEDLKDSPKPEPIVKKPNSELEIDEHIPLMILGNASIDDLKTTKKIEKMEGLSDSV
ncbi:rho gtpase-activating protein gack [Anaeramoeba flamelloides]|uniref:Rho gtpase-activating protein gack n=1 Tax=Anaeramoeba flamelloides TaxID=1746091 RepID=A0AAV7YTZ6_9EUKA|nr:rho gtpase-activating protein gack [Anaeramoeba flamelloides]